MPGWVGATGAWIWNTGLPGIGRAAASWWRSVDVHPYEHAGSMVLGVVIYRLARLYLG